MKFLTLLAALGMAGHLAAADQDGFVPLFNGHDLSGWVNANCAPETWSVKDGNIHCTGHPTGAMRTLRQYENFILEVDWRHLSSGGNSGVFIWGTPIAAPGVPFLRGIEVQVLDHGYNSPGKNEWYTTHGDVFPIHGAKMKPFGRHNGDRSFPSAERSKGFPEWNHYRITGSNGVLRLEVNGAEVSGGEDCNYRKGYLALESEGAPVEFRNIRIKELPSTGADPEVTAPLEQGWKPLFTGLDLRGWRTNTGTANRWSSEGEHLTLRGGTADHRETLWTEAEFGKAEFVIDCRLTRGNTSTPIVLVRGKEGKGIELPLLGTNSEHSQRFVIRVSAQDAVVTVDGKETGRVALPLGTPERGAFGFSDGGAGVEFMNLYVRKL